MSDTADYNDELFEDELIRVSESDDVRSRATFKDKFTSSIVVDKSYLCDFKIIPPSLQVIATSIIPGLSQSLTRDSHHFTGSTVM